MKKRVIIGVSLFLLLLIGITYAWFTWNSEENTNVGVTIEGINITYEDGEDIKGINLIPVSSKEKGENDGTAIAKEITVSSNMNAYLDLNMNLEILPDGLKDASFKWEIYKGDELKSSGNFADNNQGDNISLLSNELVTSTESIYKLYIWIDGTMSNPNTMQNQEFKFILNASVGEQSGTSIIPRTSSEMLEYLGLILNEGMPDFSNEATEDEGIYQSQDDYGISYYFRGAVENNYLKFGKWKEHYIGFNSNNNIFKSFNSLEECTSNNFFNNNCTFVEEKDMYWRIIRINGDGSLRLIYDGTSAHVNGERTSDKNIGASMFNELSNDNAYVGYMFGTPASNTYLSTHTNINDSTIKKEIDEWYKINFANTEFEDKIADVIYCNDRSLDTGNGYSTNKSIYSSKVRIWDENIIQPTLNCIQSNDAFTVDDLENGNGALTYPVGLITIDEVIMSGKNWLVGSNDKYYLYSGYGFWTMSPCAFGTSAEVFREAHGWNNNYVTSFFEVRPVISLKSSVELSGSGTMLDPYVVEN